MQIMLGVSLVALTIACSGKSLGTPAEPCPEGCPAGFICRVSDDTCVALGLDAAVAAVDAALPPDARAADAGAPAAPDTIITTAPAGLSSHAAVSIPFISTQPPSTFVCTLDGAAAAACVSPYSATVADGAHVFTVAAIDAAGVQDPTPASASFTVDTQPPDTTITSGPTGTVHATSAMFTFTATETGSTFACALDGGASAACASGQTFTVAAGAHVFAVAATDPAGNTDPTPATRSWTVVLLGPDAVFTSAPGPLTGPQVSFAYTTDPNVPDATFVCSIDGAPFVACPTTGVSTTLADGPHSFSVEAVDDSGDVGPPATVSFTVDALGPVVTITAPANGATVGASLVLTFTSPPDPGATFVCTLDGTQVVANCQSGVGFAGVAAGAHFVTVVGTDEFGNVGPPARSDFTVSAGATVAITGISPSVTPGGVIYTPGAATIQYVTGAAVSVACALDGQAVACTLAGGFAFNGLTAGPHTFTITGSDALGQPGAPASITFTVDLSGPLVAIDPPADARADAGFDTCRTGTVTFHCDAANSGPDDCPAASLACSLDGRPFADCSSGTLAFDLTQREETPTHTLTVEATDGLGNQGPPATISWNADTSGPDIAITSPAGSAGISGQIVYTADGTLVGTPTCKLESAAGSVACATQPCGGPPGAPGFYFCDLDSHDNPFTVDIVGHDACGNSSGTATTALPRDPITFTAAAGPPLVTSLTAANAAGGTVDVTYTMSAPLGLAHVWLVLDDDAPLDLGAATATTVTLHEVGPGHHHIGLYGEDPLGNNGASSPPLPVPPAADGVVSPHAAIAVAEIIAPGDAVLIGHDFSDVGTASPGAETPVQTVLDNAIGLCAAVRLGFARPIRVLGLETGDIDPAEKANVLAAIAARYGDEGLDWEYTALHPAASGALAAALAGEDVFLVLDENDPAVPRVLGDTPGDWDQTLVDFVGAGGTVIGLDGLYTPNVGSPQPSGSAAIIGALLPVESEATAAGDTATLFVANDPVADGPPLTAETYPLPASSVAFTLAGNAASVYEVTGCTTDAPPVCSTAPVVVHRIVNPQDGRAVTDMTVYPLQGIPVNKPAAVDTTALVVFQDQAGGLIGIRHVDARGMAAMYVAADATVSAAQSAFGQTTLYTVMNVQPGDHLVAVHPITETELPSPTNPSDPMITVASPGDFPPDGSSEGPIEETVLNAGCDDQRGQALQAAACPTSAGVTSALMVAEDLKDGSIRGFQPTGVRAYAWATGLPVVDDAVTVTGPPDQPDWFWHDNTDPSLVFHYVNPPDLFGSLDQVRIFISFRAGNESQFQHFHSSNSDTSPFIDLPLFNPGPDSGYDDNLYIGSWIVYDEPHLNAQVMSSFRTTLYGTTDVDDADVGYIPVVHDVAVANPASDQPTLTLSLGAGDLSAAQQPMGSFSSFYYCLPGETFTFFCFKHTWSIVTPGPPASGVYTLTLPPLPAADPRSGQSLAAWQPAATGNIFQIGSGIFFNGSVFPDYAAVRAFGANLTTVGIESLMWVPGEPGTFWFRYSDYSVSPTF